MTPVRVVLVGAGPRGTGLLDRLTTVPRLEVHVIDRDPFGGAAVAEFWRTIRLAPPGVAVRTYRATAVDVAGAPDGPQRVRLASGTEVTADVVVLAQGAVHSWPLRASDDPLTRALAARGELAGWSGTGALLDRTGRAHPRRFAYSAATTDPGTLLTVLATIEPDKKPKDDLSRVEVRRVPIDHPDVVPMFAELAEEYAGRYGHHGNLYDLPDGEFDPPDGVLLVLREDGHPVAGGAFRRYDAGTAELKRIWTHTGHRRRGLARRVVAELERAAAELGYRSVYLTTGPRQPEARALYLAAGYQPLFDLAADPESLGGPLPFSKCLSPLTR